MGYKVNNKAEAYLDKNRLDSILHSKDWSYAELHLRIEDRYGLELKYKGFINTINNTNVWKLTYAMAICGVLEVPLEALFTLEKSVETSD